MPISSLRGRLRRPAQGIGQTAFDVDIDINDLEGEILRRAGPAIAQAAVAGASSRFAAYTAGASFYGGRGGGFGSIGIGGGRFGFGGAAGVAGGIFAAGAIRDLSRDLIEASASFETFQRTVQATEQTAEDAEVRWERLLEIANQTVGIDVAGLVQYNSQLRVVGVSAERVDAVLRGVVRSVSELGRGAHVSREALNQLTDGVVRSHLTVRDWRAIVARVPQFLEAASRALGTTVLSLDDFRNASEASGVSISEGILRSLEELDRTAVGLEGTYVAAVDRFEEASFKLRATLGEDLKDAVTPVVAGLAEAMNSLNDALNQTPEDRLRQLLARLEEVRGSRTLLGDNPLQREAVRDIQRFLQQNPGALPDTSPGAFRRVESDSRRAARPQVEQPTAASLDFFANARQDRRLQEEFLRADLQGTAGDYANQLATTERQITETVARLRSALEVDTAQQTVSQQAIVEGLQSELDTLFQKLPVLRELVQERERELRITQQLSRESEIATERFTAQFAGFPGVQGDDTRTREREARRQREGQAALNAFIRRNQGYTGIGVGVPFDPEARQAERESETAIATRRFIEANRGYAGILTGNQARIPSLEDLEAQSTARFRELGRGRGDRELQQFINEALRDGPEGIDPQTLFSQYEEYQQRKAEAEREDLRRQRQYARQYQRIWDNAFGSLADTAIDAIFNRSLNLTDALTGIAQQTLSDLTGFYLRQFLGGGNAGGLFGSGTAAGAGVALGGAGLLFPTEFENLFQGIGGELSNLFSGVQRLFHYADTDLYAQATGARVVRSIEGDAADARRNARDFSDNFGEGFQRAARGRGGQDGVLNLTINVADLINANDDGIIQLSVRMNELRETGELPS